MRATTTISALLGFIATSIATAQPPDMQKTPPAANPKNASTPTERVMVPYSPENVEKAVTKSLPLLWKGIEGHSERRTCYTCHNHAVPMLAFLTARERGFEVDEKKLKEQTDFLLDYLEVNREKMEKGRGPGDGGSGETDTTAYVFLSLQALGHQPDKLSDTVVRYTLSREKTRDHWRTLGRRHPSESSNFTATALAVSGLRQFAPKEQEAEIAKRIAAARDWLIKTPAPDTEDRVFRLIGLQAADAPAEEIAKAAKVLAASQRDDGGWGQTDKMASDAYATGTALYALHLAGGMATDDPNYRRGLTFLLSDQLADGSWHVRSRSRPFQTYFETGFPHGKDQFISCAASGWATTALAMSRPIPKQK